MYTHTHTCAHVCVLAKPCIFVIKKNFSLIFSFMCQWHFIEIIKQPQKRGKFWPPYFWGYYWILDWIGFWTRTVCVCFVHKHCAWILEENNLCLRCSQTSCLDSGREQSVFVLYTNIVLGCWKRTVCVCFVHKRRD